VNIRDLRREHRAKKRRILARIDDFRGVLEKSDDEVFAELAYCICTAQAKAREADKAIGELKKTGLLYRGNARDIKPYLSGVRFWNNKAVYIVAARRRFTDGGRLRLKGYLVSADPFRIRHELASSVLGLGYKESSHFLRNIGLGEDLAILDRYVLRCLKRLNVIKAIPASLTEKRYLSIEEAMRRFSDRVRIPMAALDLLLWSSQTGEIFK
jgi:N-glycosylase/DNA lyase